MKTAWIQLLDTRIEDNTKYQQTYNGAVVTQQFQSYTSPGLRWNIWFQYFPDYQHCYNLILNILLSHPILMNKKF